MKQITLIALLLSLSACAKPEAAVTVTPLTETGLTCRGEHVGRWADRDTDSRLTIDEDCRLFIPSCGIAGTVSEVIDGRIQFTVETSNESRGCFAKQATEVCSVQFSYFRDEGRMTLVCNHEAQYFIR